MKKFRIYFVDREGYGGFMVWNAENITEIKRDLKRYIDTWQLAPISDLEINEI